MDIFSSDRPEEVRDPEHVALSADVMFLTGALKAAKNTPPRIREKVLMDIQAIMKCSAEELEFMFSAHNDNSDHSVYDFPDSERRRMIIRNNNLDAAE